MKPSPPISVASLGMASGRLEAADRMVEGRVLVRQQLGADVLDEAKAATRHPRRILHGQHVEAVRRPLEVDGVDRDQLDRRSAISRWELKSRTAYSV